MTYTSDSASASTALTTYGTLFTSATVPYLSLGVSCTLPASTAVFDAGTVSKSKYQKNLTAVVSAFSGVDTVSVSTAPATATGGGVVRSAFFGGGGRHNLVPRSCPFC